MDNKRDYDKELMEEIRKRKNPLEYTWSFNEKNEFEIDDRFKISIDRDKLVNSIKNSKEFNSDAFSIDFYVDEDGNRCIGKLDMFFDAELNESGERDYYYYPVIRFNGNQNAYPYKIRIIELYVDQTDLSSKDAYLKFFFHKVHKSTYVDDPNLSDVENLVKHIDQKIAELDAQEKKSVTKDEKIKIGKDILKVTDENNLKIVELDTDKAIYMYEENRGGNSIIVGEDGSFLFFASSVDFSKALEEFRNGKRSK